MVYLDSHDVFLLTCVLVQRFDELARLLWRHTLDVVHVRGDVEVHAAAGLVACKGISISLGCLV